MTPKYVEERDRRPKRRKPIDKLSRKVLMDKIEALKHKRDRIIASILSGESYDTRLKKDSLLVSINHELTLLDIALQNKEKKNAKSNDL